MIRLPEFSSGGENNGGKFVEQKMDTLASNSYAESSFVLLLGCQFVSIGVGQFPKLPRQQHHRDNDCRA
jgi:hypothetical protein